MPDQRGPRGRAALDERHALKHLPSHARLRSLGDRTLSWLIALLLCCTMLPVAALASPHSHAPSNDAATPSTSTDTLDGTAAETLPDGDASESDASDLPGEPAGAPTESGSTGADGAASESPIPDATVVNEQGDLDKEQDQLPQETASFGRSAYAIITVTGNGDAADRPLVGARAHAVVFHITNEQSLSCTEVPDDGTFSYTWYACDERSPRDLAESDVIVGAHASSLALSEALVGKYLFVRVTASDGSTAYGPHFLDLPTGFLRGIGPVEPSEEAEPEEPEPEDPAPEIPDVPPAPSEPEEPGNGSGTDEEAVELCASVTVTGTTRHAPGTSFYYANWVPKTEFRWSSKERTTAWDAFAQLLRKNGYSFSTGYGYPSSITTPDGGYTLAMSTEGAKSYWSFRLNGETVDLMTCDYLLRDGDSIELRYIDATSTEESAAPEIFPEETTPDAPVAWGGPGSNGTGASTSLVTPTTDLSTGWTFDLSEGLPDAGWADPLIVNDRIYLATATRFCVMDRESGKLLGSTPLAGTVQSGGCQPVYVSGKVIVPLANGRLQAFSVSTMHCIWVSESLTECAASIASVAFTSSEPQSVSSLYLHEGRLYVATASTNGQGGGRLACLDVKTGALCWVRENVEAGFYWPGTAQLNGYILVGGEDGVLQAIPSDSADGEAVGAVRLADQAYGMRSAVVAQDDHAYCVTRDGVFHKVSVGEDGTLAETGRVAFAASSSSTPTVSGGSAYVGGANADGTGVLACIDTETLSCRSISGAGSASLPAEVKGTPLVSNQPTGTFVYFTCDSSASGVYLYKVGDATARVIYEPDAGMSGSLSSMVVGPDGRLYCVSTSGQLIELREQVAGSVPTPAPGTSGNGEAGRAPADTATLERMMDAMGDARSTSLNAAPQRLGTTNGIAPTTPIAPGVEEEDATETAGVRRSITSFIEDITMQAQNVSLSSWLLFASGGLAVGAVALLALVIPVRARRSRLRS